jgi:hypothetical protein
MWLWRIIPALVGTAAYQRIFRPDWRNPALLLYDVPTLLVAFSFGGAALNRIAARDSSQGLVRLVALLVAAGLASGAQFRDWRLSGHLTVAMTVALLEGGDASNPLWLRVIVWAPVACLLLIRTFRPQIPLMADRFNTVSALIIGGIIGAAALFILSRLK